MEQEQRQTRTWGIRTERESENETRTIQKPDKDRGDKNRKRK